MTHLKNIEIIDVYNEFFNLFESNKSMSLEDLEFYYKKFPDVFNDYFKSHCKRTPERLNAAIERYPSKYNAMRRVANLLPSIVHDVYEQMSTMFGIQMDLRISILVGGFGSNAYVTHDGTIHFAIETLSDEPEHLRVLVAHEMAHAFHFNKLKMEGFDFSKMAWDGYTSLYLEGIATYLSERLNPDLPECVYLSFDNSGEEWINFFQLKHSDILFSFEEDLRNWTMEEEREWFRLSGGKRYGYNRLGYLIGKELIRDSALKYGLNETITIWARNEIKPLINEWLSGKRKQPYPSDAYFE